MTKKVKEPINELSDLEVLQLPPSRRQDYFFKNRIPQTLLIVLFKDSKTSGKVSDCLGQVYLAVVKKVSGMGSWRGYTLDYKEMMEGRALEHLCKYGHNFDPLKSKRDATNYLIQICWRAFCQSLKKAKYISAHEATELSESVDYALSEDQPLET